MPFALSSGFQPSGDAKENNIFLGYRKPCQQYAKYLWDSLVNTNNLAARIFLFKKTHANQFEFLPKTIRYTAVKSAQGFSVPFCFKHGKPQGQFKVCLIA